MVGVGTGLTVTARVETGPFPHALLVPLTATLPEALPNVTVMVFVLAPLVMYAPGGTVHTYPVAFVIGNTEYTLPATFAHTLAEPVIVPGFPGELQLRVVKVISLPYEVPTLLAPLARK